MKSPEQQPLILEDRKKYTENENRLVMLKAKALDDLSMEEFQEFKKIKKDNENLFGKAQDEAGVEEKERKMYDEAKAEVEPKEEKMKSIEDYQAILRSIRLKEQNYELSQKIVDNLTVNPNENFSEEALFRTKIIAIHSGNQKEVWVAWELFTKWVTRELHDLKDGEKTKIFESIENIVDGEIKYASFDHNKYRARQWHNNPVFIEEFHFDSKSKPIVEEEE